MPEAQQPITGYRDLSTEEKSLINDIKAHEAATASLVGRVTGLQGTRTSLSEQDRQIAIARTDFEAAFMRLTRAVARPITPWK